MGLTHVTVALKGFDASNGSYEADFLIDTGATDCLASALELKKIGVREVGRTAYEPASGRVEEYSFGLVEIAFMGEITAGRVIFGPDGRNPSWELRRWNRLGSPSIPQVARLSVCRRFR